MPDYPGLAWKLLRAHGGDNAKVMGRIRNTQHFTPDEYRGIRDALPEQKKRFDERREQVKADPDPRAAEFLRQSDAIAAKNNETVDKRKRGGKVELGKIRGRKSGGRLDKKAR